MDRWESTARKKLRHGESQNAEDRRWRRSQRETVRRETMQVREKVGKWFWGSGGSTSRLAKAAGAELAGQMRDEQFHAVVTRSTFESEYVQNTPFSDHFWKLRCRKVHTVVARGTFGSQHAHNKSGSEPFWKLT